MREHKNLGNPENSENLENSENSENSENLETPETPEILETPETPEISETSVYLYRPGPTLCPKKIASNMQAKTANGTYLPAIVC